MRFAHWSVRERSAGPLPKWQPPDADAFAIRRDRGAFGEGVLALKAHRLDQIRLALSVKSLNAQQHPRRASLAGPCQVRVEVVVQGLARPFIVSGRLQNLDVLSFLHPDFGYMNCIHTAPAKNRSRMPSEPLIEQNAFHATRSMLKRSSSTVAAA